MAETLDKGPSPLPPPPAPPPPLLPEGFCFGCKSLNAARCCFSSRATVASLHPELTCRTPSLRPRIIHRAQSTSFEKERKEKKTTTETKDKSPPPPPSSSVFIILSISVSSLVLHSRAPRADGTKAARIRPCARPPARRAPARLSASLCVSRLIGNN